MFIPAKSSPTTDTRRTFAPVLMAASAILRPTPPNVCVIFPGVEVYKTDDLIDGLTVEVISRATPPITNN